MNWLFGGGNSEDSGKSNKKQNATILADTSNSDVHVKSFKEDLSYLINPYLSIPLSCAGVLGTMMLYRRYLRRIPSAEYITPRTLARRSSIRGYVTSVGDADNFRMVHTPLPWPFTKLQRIPTDKKVLKNNTIHVRLAGVDAPELAHFGKPAQPYSSEALAFLTSLVNGRRVKVELCSKDHYGRMVGLAFVRKPFFWPWRKNVSLEMLKVGLATVYDNAGAEYGSIGKEKLLAAEAKAKRKRKGMWAQKSSAYESPAEYKRRHSS
ncbi:SNase-domain-containing protein [Cystobasidium minutum MCA 4210]|uniref:SNase-domain-containing protein n=1 Tax=Cystobasidium minutum MCA 4210 TaxID=1397322 RepID=UPI0034CE6202|eukprot:jgi/Rhomi1/19984/CE19983_600